MMNFARIRPTVPAVPVEWIARLGTPEEVFAPNMRFRIVSGLLGAILVLIAIMFFVYGVDQDRTERGIYSLLGAGLIGVGTAAVALPRRVPLQWMYICPRGVLRDRGGNWDGLAWSDVARFEDATLPGTTVVYELCRIVSAEGLEWGFHANFVVRYARLVDVIRRTLAAQPAASASPQSEPPDDRAPLSPGAC